MRFPFNEKKAAQAAAYIVRKHRGRFNYISLIRVLYLADRKALVETGVPITGDQMVSMDKGPVLSCVKNCLNRERGFGDIWCQIVSRRDDENNVYLVTGEPSRDELCDYEIGVLDAVYLEHGRKTPGQLIQFCHDLPEWEDPDGSALPIRPETILRKENVPQSKIEAAAARAALLMQAVDTGGSGL